MSTRIRQTISQRIGVSMPLALIVFLIALPAYAHNVENIEGSPKGKPLAPHITEEPALLFDAQTRAILSDPLDRDCNELRALSPEAKHFLLDRATTFQTPDMLKLIIGPDCPLFGDIPPVAEIRDPSLLVGNAQAGTLYYISSLNLLFVTNPETQSVAYAMEGSGTGAAVSQFLERRSEAERLATIGDALFEALEPLRASSSSEQQSVRSEKTEPSGVTSSYQAKSSAKTSPSSAESTYSQYIEITDTTSQEAYEANGENASQAVSDAMEESESRSSTSSADVPVILRKLDPIAARAGNIPVIAIIIAVITLAIVATLIVRSVLKHRNEIPPEVPESDEHDEVNPEA